MEEAKGRINFWLSQDDIDWLLRESRSQGRTVSGQLRYMIMKIRESQQAGIKNWEIEFPHE